MSLNPLAPVTNHHTKLSRIFWFTSLVSVVAIWLLREHVEPIDLALGKIDDELSLGEKLPLSAGYLLPALAVGVVSRVVRLHDRISDLLGIRERFDVEVIIAELASGAGFDLSGVTDDQLVRHRRQIMGRGFYDFTSKKDGTVDEHLVHQALDWWSWLWVVLEAALVFALTGLALIAYGVYALGVAVLFGTLALAALLLPMFWSQCRRYAVVQVAAIVADTARANRVVEVFRETIGHSRGAVHGWHVSGATQQHSALEERLQRHLKR